MPYVPIAQDLSGHGLQRRLGVTGIRNSLIPVAAKEGLMPYCETFGRSPTGIMMWAYGVPFHIT
jgi:hypothetical protein